MSELKMYTLEAARKELARRECQRHGHSFDVIEMRTLGGDARPTAVNCDRCGRHWLVISDPSGAGA